MSLVQGLSAENKLGTGQSDALHPNKEVEKRLAKIYRLNRKAIDLRLERSPYAQLLEKLGNPHLDTPPVIHVAGTNGKGSTIAFTRSILNEAGYRTHVYTSPHLTLFNERIVLNGTYVSDNELIEALDYIDSVNGEIPVTFFEYTSALAFYLYAKHKNDADFLLLEVGMGGRLDCTNIVEKPLCTAITKIGFDHTQYLGDTAALISAEKAGIMKRGVPCVIAPQDQDIEGEVNATFAKIAHEKGVELYQAAYAGQERILGLVGAHQYENAGTALEIVNVLIQKGYDISDKAIQNGLAHTTWHGRMERITKGAFFQQMAQMFSYATPEIYFDGGHNVLAAQALTKTFSLWKKDTPMRPINLFFGMGYDKDINGFLDIVSPYIDGLYIMDVKAGLHPQTAQDLYAKLKPEYKEKAQIFNDAHAIKPVHTNIDYAPIFMVCGSLFLYEYVVAQ